MSVFSGAYTSVENKLRTAGKRLLREESGFTLVELLVTVLMLVVVMFALTSIFQTSLRIFSLSNDKVEATETARVGLERMERELRMAYPGDAPSDVKGVLCATGSDYCTYSSATSTSIAFGNDLNADRNICESPGTCSASKYDPNELIRYYLADSTDDTDAIPDTIFRQVYPAPGLTAKSPEPLVTVGNGGSLTLTYFAEDGGDTGFEPDPISAPLDGNPSTGTEKLVKMVRIQLTVKVDRGSSDGADQKLSTDVTLRNRSR